MQQNSWNGRLCLIPAVSCYHLLCNFTRNGVLSTILTAAFLIGLLSTLHCLGMCGGISGALTFSLPPEIREHRWRLLPYVSAYNLGRISSYTAAGALGGALGSTLFAFLSPRYGHLILQGFAVLLLVGIGLYLAGWFPRFALIERLGMPLWKKLEPVGRRLLPVRSPYHAYLFGLAWGWLPCGLVYAAVLWSTSAGGAFQGALFMLAFGAGTLPAVMSAGIFAGWMAQLTRLPHARQIVGAIIIIIALAGVPLALDKNPNDAHGIVTHDLEM